MTDTVYISDQPSREEHDQPALYPIWVRLAAKCFSYLFHPLFIPVYVAIFLLYIHPSAFSGFGDGERRQTLLIIMLNLVFFPLITVLLLKALGFIESIYLRGQKDRIIPYIAAGIFYFWAFTVFRQQPHYPLALTSFVLGAFLAASLALILNIYIKVSMHAIGLGGMVGLLLILAWTNNMMMTWPLALALLISGFVCTSRLVMGAHLPKDIYIGFLSAIAMQFIAYAYISP